MASLVARLNRSLKLADEKPNAIRVYARRFGRPLLGAIAVLATLLGTFALLKEGDAHSIKISDVLWPMLLIGTVWASYFFAFASYIYDVLRYFRTTDPIDPRREFRALPIRSSVETFIKDKNIQNMAIDGAIEVGVHPFIDATLDDNGWPIDNVLIRLSKSRHKFRPDILGEAMQPERNNKKYNLKRISPIIADDLDQLELDIEETDWSETQQALKSTFSDEAKRHQLAHVDPVRHKTPNPLCLHFIVLLSDGNVLALKRSPDLRYWPNHLSISFEEQLSEDDIPSGEKKRMTTWLKRALCEELFPLTGAAKHDLRWAWDRISAYIRSSRIWSCILEEPTSGFALFGVVQLTLSIDEFAREYRSIEQFYGTRRDNEGGLFYLTTEELEGLLAGLPTKIRSVFAKNVTEDVDLIHPTSRYRASMLLSALRHK